jgi:hypothetical protein
MLPCPANNFTSKYKSKVLNARSFFGGRGWYWDLNSEPHVC